MQFWTSSKTFSTPWDFSRKMPRSFFWAWTTPENRPSWLFYRAEESHSWTRPNTPRLNVLRLTTSASRPLTWEDIRPWGRFGESISSIFRELFMWSTALTRSDSRSRERSLRRSYSRRSCQRSPLLYWAIRLTRRRQFRRRSSSRCLDWPLSLSLELRRSRSCMEDPSKCSCARLLRRLESKSLLTGSPKKSINELFYYKIEWIMKGKTRVISAKTRTDFSMLLR